MKVLCRSCKTEFDWGSEEIFFHPWSYNESPSFICRDCLKETRDYKKGKMNLTR